MRPEPRAAGFSLIELLVVVAIIVVLAGVLAPAAATVRATARQSVCGSNLRQIGLGIEAYRGDWNGVIPAPLTNTLGDATPGTGHDYPPDDYYDQWYAPLRSYLDTPDNHTGTRLWICPASNWSSRTAKAFGLSYGMNGGPIRSGVRIFPFSWNGIALGGYSGLPDLVLLGERRAIGLTGGADYNGTVSPPYLSAPQTEEGPWAGDPAALRATHRGRSQYLLADGHVENLAPYERCNPANTALAWNTAPNIWIGLP